MMMIKQTAATTTPRAVLSTRSICARPSLLCRSAGDNNSGKTSTETRLSPDQRKEVESKDPLNVFDISPKSAEMRADLGKAVTDGGEVQAFDGPGPETINSRLAMLGVLVGLAAEWFQGLGLREQVGDHPYIVIASFIIISIATYVPISKGYTRKEAFSNGPWTPKAENWNGRIAMMGFLGMVITEAIAHKNVLEVFGLATKFTQ